MPEDDCLDTWQDSLRVSNNSDELIKDEGTFRIERDSSGGFKGWHIISSSQQLPLSNVSCKPGTKHHILEFTRTSADGKFACTYNGKVVKVGDNFVIFHGTYKSSTTAAADDNGDWSAGKPGA